MPSLRSFSVALVLLSSLILMGCSSPDESAQAPESAAIKNDKAAELTDVIEQTEEPTPEPRFPAETVNDLTITDPNGYEAVIHQELSGWVPMTGEEALVECNSDELSYAEEGSVVYGRRLTVSATFPQTDFGDFSSGGSNLITLIEYATDGGFSGTVVPNLLACRSSHIQDGDYYSEAGKWAQALFDLMPSTPEANMTLFIVVPKTPENPDGALPEQNRPRLGAVVGGHSAPETITSGMTTGRADDFEDYTKFGGFGEVPFEDGFSGPVVGPSGGSFE